MRRTTWPWPERVGPAAVVVLALGGAGLRNAAARVDGASRLVLSDAALMPLLAERRNEAAAAIAVSRWAGRARTAQEWMSLGAATATLLQVGPQPGRPPAMVVAGLEEIRSKLGPDAPPAAALSRDPVVWGSLRVSAATAAEALRRSALPGWDPVPPLGAIGAAIRSGQAVDDAVWATIGAAGFAALEAGRAGRTDLRDEIEGMVADPPSAPDGMAGRFVLTRIGIPSSGG